MKRRLLRITLWLSLVLVLFVAADVAGAWFMLDYALRPSRQSEAAAWEGVVSSVPEVRTWADSLRAGGLLRDTTLQAADGTHLHAWYVRSEKAQGRTALLIHGYRSCAPTMMHLGRMYNHDLDCNILLPDLRYAGRSGGEAVGMGWHDRLDILQWIKVAPQLFGSNTRLVVHGISMGAATTMMTAGEPTPAYVRAFVEDCGYTSVEDQFRKELGEQFHLPSFPLLPTASLLCRFRYGWTFGEASAVDAVKRCTKPMLFIHGSADKYVPTRMVTPLYNAKPQPKALWVAPAAEHAQSYDLHPQEYTQRVRDFLQPYMK